MVRVVYLSFPAATIEGPLVRASLDDWVPAIILFLGRLGHHRRMTKYRLGIGATSMIRSWIAQGRKDQLVSCGMIPRTCAYYRGIKRCFHSLLARLTLTPMSINITNSLFHLTFKLQLEILVSTSLLF